MAVVGWDFSDQALVATVRRGDGPEFQRLEFLGDAIAQAIVVPLVYRWSVGSVAILVGASQHLLRDSTFGYLSSLTGLRALLDPAAAAIPERPGDAIEALVAAAYLDGGWPAATKVCSALIGEWLDRPDGVSAEAARIDTTTAKLGPGEWQCRFELWLAGADTAHEGSDTGSTRQAAELAAVTNALEVLGRGARYVWIEAGEELRDAVVDPMSLPDGSASTVVALRAAYDGVWFLPGGDDAFGGRLDNEEHVPDGKLTAFERVLGRDLASAELERFATRPGCERRRLSFVGDSVVKATAAIRAFTQLPDASEHILSARRNRLAKIMSRPNLAFDTGLVGASVSTGVASISRQLVLSALGVIAVNEGPDEAVRLADSWIGIARRGSPNRREVTVITVDCEPGRPEIRLVLASATAESSWTLVDAEVPWLVLALEGTAAAIDSIPAADESHPVLLSAPQRIIELLEGQSSPTRTDIKRAALRVQDRICRRNLAVISEPLPPVPGRHK